MDTIIPEPLAIILSHQPWRWWSPSPAAISCRRSFSRHALLRQPPPGARLIAPMPLGNPGGLPTPPFGRLLGAGLDARLFADLSPLSADGAGLADHAERSFLRQDGRAVGAHPHRFVAHPRSAGAWTRRSISACAALEPLAGAGGRYLIECSGNADQSQLRPDERRRLGRHPARARSSIACARRRRSYARPHLAASTTRARVRCTSVPGASWIFSRDDLQRALLAVRMNGAPLPARPRLPGPPRSCPAGTAAPASSGSIASSSSPDDAPATAQMREFAARTHQPSSRAQLARRPRCARDFTPAVIDTRGDAGPRREMADRRPPRLSRHRHRLGRLEADQRAVDPLPVRPAVGDASTTARCRRRR